MAGWYSRAVFFVTDIEQAMQFYGEALEFREAWRFEERGSVIVVQMNHQDCEIILSIDAERAGSSRLFISLEAEEMARLQSRIAEQEISARKGWWGYQVIELRDPDGNELFFPLEGAST